ncbi:hypothetical protein [Nitratifractor salsuginis]|uniref:Uncharacterized protein n=1 Tax=Nitratifractor salsuginis (strain DSM 16511 / JCM 12458 / E9I37-1) TaxID=749222 RepID=E6X0Z1_NITSE|nr:hypothetical protein [Nitratifractor salsuginis]ADV46923.1 hypothetical protein Nitsa_1675 [Nitratifractor salsuginis DSM 16511]
MPANNIVLSDYYSDKLYLYDLDKNVLLLLENSIKHDKFTGWVAFEKCGLFKKKIVTTGLFYLNGEVFFIWDKKYYRMNNDIAIKINDFYFLIRLVKIKINNTVDYLCKQWSKDIDPFEMDDFFYFFEYSAKHNFENIKSLRR